MPTLTLIASANDPWEWKLRWKGCVAVASNWVIFQVVFTFWFGKQTAASIPEGKNSCCFVIP